MKVTSILLIALGVTACLRRQSASVRHGILAAAIACAACLPVLERVVPAWTLPLATSSFGATDPIGTVTLQRPTTDLGPSRAVVPQPSSSVEPGTTGPAWLRIAGWIWFTGTALALAILAAGIARLGSVAARAERLSEGRWVELSTRLAGEFGLRRPVTLLQSDHPTLLVTWGLRRPKIVLPAAATGWSDEMARTVLLHELAHIRRGDWIVQMLGELLRAVYWFNPIVWIACRRLRLESEHACDDEVMGRGVEASDYAERLVELARALNRYQIWFPAAPAMARRSSLERRITAMLTSDRSRQRLTLRTRTAIVAALVAITVALAAAQTSGSVAGTVVDPQGAVLPGVRLTLSNADKASKYEAVSSRTGQFEFAGLPPGEYVLETRVPGFATSKQPVRVTGAGAIVQRQIAMEIGSLEETVTVSDEGADAAAGGEPRQMATARANPPCRDTGSSGPQIGGNIRPPMRVRDAKPLYPANLRGTGTEGVVVMEGHIGLDGFVRDLRVRSSTNADFRDAATSAVREWQWDSTLLNCVPVEVAITVTARFVHQR